MNDPSDLSNPENEKFLYFFSKPLKKIEEHTIMHIFLMFIDLFLVELPPAGWLADGMAV